MSSSLLADLPTRVDEASHRCASRLDPYWQGLWFGGSQVSWMHPDMADRLQRAGWREPRTSEQAFSREEALESVFHHKRRGDRLRALAALLQWRTLTHEQLNAISGNTNPHTRHDRWAPLNLLWIAGLIERGTMVTDPTVSFDAPHLYRPLSTNELDRQVAGLPYGEWVGVTGGLGTSLTAGPQHDRHNVLTAELALRVAEHCEIGTVLGEQMAAHWLMAGPDGPTSTTNQHGDAVLVRADGLKVIVETTATAGAGWDRKVNGWLDLMSSTAKGDPGIAVLFVEAGKPDGGNTTWNFVRRKLATARRDRPLAAMNGLFDRVFATRWRWWFPGPWQVDPSFLTLKSARLDRAGEWEPAHVLDVFDVPYDGPARPPILDNHDDLLGVPYWLREHRSPRTFAQTVRDRANLGPEPELHFDIHDPDRTTTTDPHREPTTTRAA